MRRLPARTRLESRLDGALAHRLTLLVADAGFGKTTLLGSWSAGIKAVVYPVATADRDLTRLWQHLTGALRRHVPELTELAGGGKLAEAASRGPVTARSDSVRPQAMAELLGGALAQHLAEDLVLVLDDAHRLADGPVARFVAGLVRHAPPPLHLVLASRGPLPVSAGRLRAEGQVLELTGSDLAFTADEVAVLLAEVAGAGSDARGVGLAAELRAATGGWPIAVRLAVEAVRELPGDRRRDRLARLATPQGQLADLIGAIYEREPAPVRRLLGIGALFGRVTVGLCEALGVPDAAGLVAGLSRRGLFLERESAPVGPAGQWYRLHPLTRQFITAQAPLPAREAAELREQAAQWLAERGHAHTALRWLMAHRGEVRRSGRQVRALLIEAGERLAASGNADVVIDAVNWLPSEHCDGRIEQLAGHAHLVRGDWDEALARYARVAGDTEALPPGLAWRIGMVHYLRGEHDRALGAYDQADLSGQPTRDTALLLAWTAAAHWIKGDAKACGELATRALTVGTEVDDPAALAAAYTVLSMLSAMKGDRRANAARYRRALEYATKAGDVLQLIRIRSNRASHSLEEGDYGTAMAELETAIQLADLHGYGAFGGLAVTNRAEIRLWLGQLEEAQHDIEAALSIFEDLGSRKVAYPLTLLGRLHQLRGDPVAAVRVYERALAQVAASGDRQAEAAVLAGLARALAETDPQRGVEVAQQALAAGDGMGYVNALLAAARVAAAARPDDPEPVRQRVHEALAVARARRDRAGVAEAYEIEAALAGDRQHAQELAAAAVELWREMGDQIGQARAELVLAECLDDAAARVTAEAVRQRMGTIGCRSLVARAEAVLARHDAGAAATPVRIEALGGFRVVRDGAVLPATGWSSRKARDVLKILVARRGRPVTREFLMEALWPGQPSTPPAALANRLHVAISTLRTTLDPDRRHGSDAFVVTDEDTVRLRVGNDAGAGSGAGYDAGAGSGAGYDAGAGSGAGNDAGAGSGAVPVDVESFLADAAAGLALLREGRVAEARSRLTLAEGWYAGDFLEEDLYQDWAVPLREQARGAYLAVAAALAEQARAAGEVDTAARYLLRLLEHDPYDERAHLRLVSSLAAAGRHGDARRHYRTYCARMEELDVEAAPFPTPAF